MNFKMHFSELESYEYIPPPTRMLAEELESWYTCCEYKIMYLVKPAIRIHSMDRINTNIE